MNEFKSKYSKDSVENYMLTRQNDEDINYYWTIGFILFEITIIILFFTVGMSDFKLLEQSFSMINERAIVLIYVYIIPIAIMWIYAIFSILKNDFKKDIDKISWLIGTIFVPLVFAFYLDSKNKLIEN